MPESTVHAPAMVDDRCIPADREWTGKDHHAARRSGDGEPVTAAEVQPCVKAGNLQFGPLTDVGSAVAVS